MVQPKTAEEQRNAAVIRALYASAESAARDTAKFVSMFAEGGYFYDVGVGKKYYGADIGYTVDNYATAFPDMHRELYDMYFNDDVVVVELSLLRCGANPFKATRNIQKPECCYQEIAALRTGEIAKMHTKDDLENGAGVAAPPSSRRQFIRLAAAGGAGILSAGMRVSAEGTVAKAEQMVLPT